MTRLTGYCTKGHLLHRCTCKAVEHPATASHATLIWIGGVLTVYDPEQATDWQGVNDEWLDEQWNRDKRLGGG